MNKQHRRTEMFGQIFKSFSMIGIECVGVVLALVAQRAQWSPSAIISTIDMYDAIPLATCAGSASLEALVAANLPPIVSRIMTIDGRIPGLTVGSFLVIYSALVAEGMRRGLGVPGAFLPAPTAEVAMVAAVAALGMYVGNMVHGMLLPSTSMAQKK